MSQSGELIELIELNEPIEAMSVAGHDEDLMRWAGSSLKFVHEEKFVHRDFISCLTRRVGYSHA